MLVHVTPTIFAKFNDRAVDVELADINIPEFGVRLHGGRDVVATKPVPNKFYTVACRKMGREAVSGLLFDVDGAVDAYTVTTRWRLVTSGKVVSHEVMYQVLENEHDAVTDGMLLWGATEALPSRWPEYAKGYVIAVHQPRMDLETSNGRLGEMVDTMDRNGLILERREMFRLPSIEKVRLTRRDSISSRLPLLHTAMRVCAR
ncbi:hypothetical protein APB26_31920 [Pseudomonas aeruginosa]|uniref:DUF6012 family protein n=1 Tax=Pseudomonas aeruginosa TaxID=287 RepID=UPI00071B318C|nr:DUF6012 family protein [Pseudomonas aeruginosa]KSQ21596.1 hypothetical protein APB26_31920 [Pseudomonas aeruginosa]RPV61265.1 hypothetical protein IPC838_18250 [Pseudomonas aeruginosa]